MKTFRSLLMSFFVGAVLSVFPIFAVYAACDKTLAIDVGIPVGSGNICVLTGENCGRHVCVCSYTCRVEDPRQNPKSEVESGVSN